MTEQNDNSKPAHANIAIFNNSNVVQRRQKLKELLRDPQNFSNNALCAKLSIQPNILKADIESLAQAGDTVAHSRLCSVNRNMKVQNNLGPIGQEFYRNPYANHKTLQEKYDLTKNEFNEIINKLRKDQSKHTKAIQLIAERHRLVAQKLALRPNSTLIEVATELGITMDQLEADMMQMQDARYNPLENYYQLKGIMGLVCDEIQFCSENARAAVISSGGRSGSRWTEEERKYITLLAELRNDLKREKDISITLNMLPADHKKKIKNATIGMENVSDDFRISRSDSE